MSSNPFQIRPVAHISKRGDKFVVTITRGAKFVGATVHTSKEAAIHYAEQKKTEIVMEVPTREVEE